MNAIAMDRTDFLALRAGVLGLGIVGVAMGGERSGLSAPVVQPPPSHSVALGMDSGVVSNSGDDLAPIYSVDVEVPGATWIRLRFENVVLGGDVDRGDGSYLMITSHLDGAYQRLDAVSLGQWRNTSAYFNGDAVTVELFAPPSNGLNRVGIVSATVGDPPIETLCGETDDRNSFDDPRVGRIPGCSGFLIDDAFHCALTAGHCFGLNFNTMQFNVPLSDPDGGLRQAHPDDQYAIDPVSIQFTNGGVGNDWTYYGLFPNSNTNLTPFQAQRDFFVVSADAPAVGETIRINGFGRTDPPADPTLNRALKTSVGPLVSASDSTLFYEVDTTPGDSGAVVIEEASGRAVAIHTNGGCDVIPGNRGTRLSNPGFQDALAHPLGVCASVAAGDGDFDNDGDIDLGDYSAFQGCLTGPGGSTSAGCGPGDLDADGNIDLLDYRLLSGGFTGDCGTSITVDLTGDVDACFGGAAVFTIAASGSNLEWAWTRNGGIVENATSPTLIIDPVTFDTFGEYRGFAISECAVAGSSSAFLGPAGPPIITSWPQDVTACLGESATFSVSVFGVSPFTYQWMLDGEDIPGATSSSYTVGSITLDDLGTYDCRITDQCGGTVTTEEFPGELSLVVPEIVTQPEQVTICVGDVATFSVEATGEEPIQYQWRFGGFDIPGATASSYVIESAGEDDFGVYTCVVSDACGGSVGSLPGQLRLGIVDIDAQPMGGEFCTGDTVFIFAGLSGSLSIQWFKDDVAIPGATAAFLAISSVQVEDSGSYYVHATALCNEVTSEPAQITVTDCNP